MLGGDGDDELENDFVDASCDSIIGDQRFLLADTDAGDVYRGGSGRDSFTTFSEECSTGERAPTDVRISLDEVADDGSPGEGDLVATDVEDVSGNSYENADNEDTLIGDAGANSLRGLQGDDTIDGGRGNDVLSGGAGDDAIAARDGFADFVTCGEGADVATVDTLDTVSAECETVNRLDVGNANDVPDAENDGPNPPNDGPNTSRDVPEDAAPKVSFASPGSALSTTAPTTLTATATDDRGVAKVQFVDDDRIVCEDATAPYTCAYSARGEDVGRNTLAVIAIDSAQQTATALRSASVARFAPTGLSIATTPKGDTRSPFRFTTSGRLALPGRVTSALGCQGTVTVRIKAGKKTISSRRAKLGANCAYRSAVRFRLPGRLNPSKLTVHASFSGNETLLAASSGRTTVRVK